MTGLGPDAAFLEWIIDRQHFYLQPSPPDRYPLSTRSSSADSAVLVICAETLQQLLLTKNLATAPAGSAESVKGCNFHHWHRQEDNGWAISCCRCSMSLFIYTKPAALRATVDKMLSEMMPLEDVIRAMDVIAVYLRNSVVNKDTRTIAVTSAAFHRIVGQFPPAIELMILCGFQFSADRTVMSRPDLPAEEDGVMCLMELEFRLYRLHQQMSSIQLRSTSLPSEYQDASGKLLALLGSNYSEIKQQTHAYHVLGCIDQYPDEKILTCYNLSAQECPERTGEYLDALKSIATSRNSEALQFAASMAESARPPSKNQQPVISLSMAEAYQAIGAGEEADDDTIRVGYEIAVADQPPSKLPTLRDALRKIIQVRSSADLEAYAIGMGIIEPKQFQENAGDMLAPMGLRNIGNTCYLNSLLQFYFTLAPLREFLLHLDTGKLSVSAERKPANWDSAVEFARLLRHLFIGMIWIQNKRAIEPPSSLVRLIFSEQQQDVTECMDRVASFLETIMMPETGDLMRRLFFGTIEQSLRVDGELVACNTEQFNHLLINANAPSDRDNNNTATGSGGTLDECLKRYFEESAVEFGSGKATRFLSIKKCPPILTIQIQRALFNRESGKVYKANSFISFPPTLQMGRFSSAEDQSVGSLEYRLHAVFIHQGDAEFGHYWVYLYDHVADNWLSFNDSVVVPVTADVVHQDMSAGMANAYCLVYVNSLQVPQLVDTICRPHEQRQRYMEVISEEVRNEIKSIE